MESAVRLVQELIPFPWREVSCTGWFGSTVIPGAETPPRPLHLWLSEGNSSDIFPTPSSFNFSPCQRGPAESSRGQPNLTGRPLESLEQPAPGQGSCRDVSGAVGSAEAAIQDVGLRGRNAGLGGGEPVLAKCPQPAKACAVMSALLGAEQLQHLLCSVSWTWPAWVYYHNYTAICFSDTPQQVISNSGEGTERSVKYLPHKQSIMLFFRSMWMPTCNLRDTAGL